MTPEEKIIKIKEILPKLENYLYWVDDHDKSAQEVSERVTDYVTEIKDILNDTPQENT